MTVTSVKFIHCEIATAGLLRIDHIGAGVGVIIYSASRKIGVGLHILAPKAEILKPTNPIMYANTAIPHAIELLKKSGAMPPYSVAIAGGAKMLGKAGALAIGQKVVDAVKVTLNEAGIPAKLEKTGGTAIRSMILDIDDGKIKIT
ncbi:MAG TPA: chemotaxis protein CheD [Desulfatiglandales bacterium]|nr:chemotaxis protein CheD [Desulfatiglandales bacterium]